MQVMMKMMMMVIMVVMVVMDVIMVMMMVLMMMLMMMLVKSQHFIAKAAQREPQGGSMSHFIYILQKLLTFEPPYNFLIYF